MQSEAFSLDSRDKMAFKRAIRDVICNLKNAKIFLATEHNLVTEESS